MKFLLAIVIAIACGSQSCFGQELKVTSEAEVLYGESPRIVVTGLKPQEPAILHAYREARFYTPGTNKATRVLAHAYAAFQADSTGRIEVDRTAPINGTYVGADPLGLLWSGERMEWRDMGLKSSRSVLIRVERTGTASAELTLQLTDGKDRVDVQVVSEKNINGVFARPKNNSKPLPAIVLLHGSNGGSVEGSRSDAIRFAQLGYAAFALNYFSWADLGSLPKGLVNIPVENITAARTWLSNQPNVETDRVAVWGVSKGAEYALVAASNLKWIDRVVACVPSSVVWSGFGSGMVSGEVNSSWSVNGRRQPYIAYDNYDDVLEGRLSAGAVHRRSLEKASVKDRAAARIAIENSDARILLLGATRDHVWPSAEMTRDLERALVESNKAKHLTALVFEGASHFICGTGEETQLITPVVNPGPASCCPPPTPTAATAFSSMARTV